MGTIIDADQIIVLDDGICVGKGPHTQLLASCDMYRDIATLQLGEQAVVDGLRMAAGLPKQGRSGAKGSAGASTNAPAGTSAKKPGPSGGTLPTAPQEGGER